MESNGWRLFVHPLFLRQYEMLVIQAEKIRTEQPSTYQNHPTVKLLAKVNQLILVEIPTEPAHDRFNQGNTLGKEYRHWKRAKFGRYRLFFRFNAKSREQGVGKAIIYAWVNDEKTLRKEGDKNDPYAIFARGLERGEPADSFDELLQESESLDVATTE